MQGLKRNNIDRYCAVDIVYGFYLYKQTFDWNDTTISNNDIKKIAYEKDAFDDILDLLIRNTEFIPFINETDPPNVFESLYDYVGKMNYFMNMSGSTNKFIFEVHKKVAMDIIRLLKGYSNESNSIRFGK